MLEKIKGFGGQISSLAQGAVEGVTATVKDGAASMAGKASDAVSAAGQLVGEKASRLNDKVSDVATREAIAQIREVMAIAVEELRSKPISTSPVLLTARVDIVLASLEIQMLVDHDTRLLHVPAALRRAGESAAPDAAPAAQPPAAPDAPAG
jgi:hypothetical protein